MSTPGSAVRPHVDAVLAALADPVRRRLLERLAAGECAAGDLVVLAGAEFGISQPATSQHLRVLRDARVVTVRADGSRRLYAPDPAALAVVGDWLRAFQDPFAQPLDALATELARGRRLRARSAGAADADGASGARGASRRGVASGTGGVPDADGDAARPAAPGGEGQRRASGG